MPVFLSITETGDHFGVPPRVISDLLWQRKLDISRCPMIGRSRAIPVDYLPEIRAVLVAKGKLPAAEAASA